MGLLQSPALPLGYPAKQFNGIEYAHSQRWHKVRQLNSVIRSAETQCVGSAKA